MPEALFLLVPRMTGMLNSELEWVVEPTAKFQDICPKDSCLYYNSTVGFYDAVFSSERNNLSGISGIQ